MSNLSPLAVFFLLLPLHCWACTTVAFGRGATLDGSTIVTFNVDSAQLDSRMAYIPAQDHAPGSMRPVYASDGNYPRYVGVRSETYGTKDVIAKYNRSRPIAHIPQIEHTYGYWEGCYPFMNEKGLGFGESTALGKITAKRKGAGGNALFYSDTLMALALERCETARCAIQTMGYWGEAGGFYGEDELPSEAGEILTVSDGMEAWVFHIMADFDGGAVWAAQKVPEKHVAVAANNFIIRGIDFADDMRSTFMWSNGILNTAKRLVEMGVASASCTSPATFDFLQCFGADLRSEWYDKGWGAHLPDPWYTTLRMWRVQQLVSPSLQFELTDNAFDLPFSFPVDKPVGVEDAMNIQRDQLAGTPYDLSKGAMAGPYEDPNRNEGGDGVVRVPGLWPRAISLMRTSYSVVCHSSQSRPDIAWIATHQPATSIYVPFFAQSTGCHDSYMRGWQGEYDEHSAWWTFSFVSQWMRLNWKSMYETHVAPKLMKLQREVVSSALRVNGNFTSEQTAMQGRIVKEWREFGAFLIMAYSNGFINFPSIATGVGYPEQWLEAVGFRRTLEPLEVQPAISSTHVGASAFVQLKTEHWIPLEASIGFLIGSIFSAILVGAHVVISRRAKVADNDYRCLSSA